MIPARGGALVGPRHKHFRTLVQDDTKSLDSRRLSQATVLTNVIINNVSSYSRVRGSEHK